MKRTLSSALILGLLLFPVARPGGLRPRSRRRGRTETVTTPGGTTTTSTETKVKSTGDNPPPNSAGETGKTGQVRTSHRPPSRYRGRSPAMPDFKELAWPWRPVFAESGADSGKPQGDNRGHGIELTSMRSTIGWR